MSLRFQLMLVVFTLSLAGCCGPYICSQRGVYSSPATGHVPHMASNCAADGGCGQGCQDGELRLGLPFPILHAIAGPFTPHVIADPYQSAAHPPHSKFHPVPTRPVFAPLSEASPVFPGGTGIVGPGMPTLAAPSLVRPSLVPQADVMPSEPADRRPSNAPGESSPTPRLLPAPAPAEL